MNHMFNIKSILNHFYHLLLLLHTSSPPLHPPLSVSPSTLLLREILRAPRLLPISVGAPPSPTSTSTCVSCCLSFAHPFMTILTLLLHPLLCIYLLISYGFQIYLHRRRRHSLALARPPLAMPQLEQTPATQHLIGNEHKHRVVQQRNPR